MSDDDLALSRLPRRVEEPLWDIVPLTASGEEGCIVIVKDADAWLSDPDKLRSLLDLGYVRAVKRPHRFTRVFGDARRGRPR